MAYVRGVRKVDYVNKAGKQVKGYSLYLTQERPDIVGEEAFDLFCSDELAAPVVGATKTLGDLIGLEVDVRYNRRGYAESIALV